MQHFFEQGKPAAETLIKKNMRWLACLSASSTFLLLRDLRALLQIDSARDSLPGRVIPFF